MEADERLPPLHPSEEVFEIRDRQGAGGAAEDDPVELVEGVLGEPLGEEIGEFLRLRGASLRHAEKIDVELSALAAEPFEDPFGGLDRGMAEAVGDRDDEESGRFLRRAIGIDGKGRGGDGKTGQRQHRAGPAEDVTAHRQHASPRGERLGWSRGSV